MLTTSSILPLVAVTSDRSTRRVRPCRGASVSWGAQLAPGLKVQAVIDRLVGHVRLRIVGVILAESH
ncbi:hypothetical protein EV192_104192 [Actinocrispum wychmicini]|uniref:Uncharacterized protein n=1 Tax=Actinocrispum wychmicini TaxID=1213861 RepID=A0A4R2JHL8_9PSEU|nr:hypothetical protein EV192_104192 [Actinocrispum wychmicini]